MATPLGTPPRKRPSAADPLGSGRGAPQRSDAGSTARRGIRTVVLSAVALAGLAALAIGTLYSSLGPPEVPRPGGTAGAEASRPGAGSGSPDTQGPRIVGTVSVAPELRGRLPEGGTLFIIARKGPGPPFAVQRISEPHFPLTFGLGPENVMMAGAPFEGQVHLSARLSGTGAAGPAQPGDLEGEHPGQVAIGARGVDIVLSRAD